MHTLSLFLGLFQWLDTNNGFLIEFLDAAICLEDCVKIVYNILSSFVHFQRKYNNAIKRLTFFKLFNKVLVQIITLVKLCNSYFY